ncbi:MAG: radical SAM family heme chaperone HemW [Clostridiales bacterium]|nr:radical SAM family heme chaperone HemW [Clostridiales bacterium]
MRELELYIHIPFCIKKCLYCDFLSAPADVSVRDAYVDRLLEEIRFSGPDYSDCFVSSIFIGGGTPSILRSEQIEKLSDALNRNFHISEHAEFSVECNPGTLTMEKAKTMRRSGINRISMGLQSACNAELKLLGRIHTFEDFLLSFSFAREADFTNINVDLMSALPGQSAESWENTLRRTAELCPEHISAYSLILEEGTEFYTRYHEDALLRERGEEPKLLPSEEEERRMYERTEIFLRERGYQRYEISNYARPGYECRHNIGYWTGREYLGLGLGASSLIGNVRYRNTDILEDYIKTNPAGTENSRGEDAFFCREEERRGRKEEMEEFLFLGLRMTRGISRQDFRERFGMMPEDVYGNVFKRLKNDGLLDTAEGRIFLTKRGVDVSNTVFAQFLL